MEEYKVTKFNIEKILKKNYQVEFRKFLQKIKKKKGDK